MTIHQAYQEVVAPPVQIPAKQNHMQSTSPASTVVTADNTHTEQNPKPINSNLLWLVSLVVCMIGILAVVTLVVGLWIWHATSRPSTTQITDESQSLAAILKDEASQLQSDLEKAKSELQAKRKRNLETQKELIELQLEVDALQVETEL